MDSKEGHKKVPYEHERRFEIDLKNLPVTFSDYPKVKIIQGYLENPDRIRLRDEFMDGKHSYTRTMKSGSGVSRIEYECSIAKSEFDLLWSGVRCSLEKDRYFIPWNDIEIQLNIFHSRLEGYAQIEVEFKTTEAALAFIPPSWFGKEVTDDSRHDNYSLAKNGITYLSIV
jgi:CYTH domain-containing protein